MNPNIFGCVFCRTKIETQKVAEKWKASSEEVEANMEDLAKYVVEGIMEIISS